MLVKSATELIGNTPLLRLSRIEANLGLKAKIYGKFEMFNPSGSVKDRAALSMILDAEEKGILKPGSTIIEPTSGNTGIGLASIGAQRGYKVILTMPESMSIERRKMLSVYGAKIELTPASQGMEGAVNKAKELQKQIPLSVILGQFDNEANSKIHYLTTGKEIYNDLDGKVDLFVAGVGTGGTLSGTGKYLKEKNPHVRVIAVEPSSSPLLSEGVAGPHKIQGIGANFVPSILDKEIYDEVMPISNEGSFKYAKLVAREEGLLVGISSGAALAAAIKLASMPINVGKNIVVIFPDSGDRYMSTPLFED